MSATLSENLAKVRKCLKRHPQNDAELAKAWQNLSQSTQPKNNPKADSALWQEILRCQFIHQVAVMARKTMDPTASVNLDWRGLMVGGCAMAALTNILASRMIRLEGNPGPKEREEAQAVLKDYMDEVPKLAECWWTQYRQRADGWLKIGMLIDVCCWPGTAIRKLMLAVGDYKWSPVPDQSALYELLLILTTFSGPEHDVTLALFSLATALAWLPYQGDTDLSVLQKLIHIRPNALREKIKVLLKYDLALVSRFLVSGRGIPGICHSLPGGEIAHDIGSGMWKTYLEIDDEDRRKDLIFLLTCMFTLLVEDKGQKGEELMTALLLDYDFLCLVEKAICILEEAEDPMTGLKLGTLERLLLKSPIALQQVLRRDFLYIIDYLRPAKAALAETHLSWWTGLAWKVGVTEVALRTEIRAESERAVGVKVVGCSWLKCIRFGQDCDLKKFFWCAGCQVTVYCSELCQTQDWMEGSHNQACGRRQLALLRPITEHDPGT